MIVIKENFINYIPKIAQFLDKHWEIEIIKKEKNLTEMRENFLKSEKEGQWKKYSKEKIEEFFKWSKFCEDEKWFSMNFWKWVDTWKLAEILKQECLCD